jgi:hypothetical protein
VTDAAGPPGTPAGSDIEDAPADAGGGLVNAAFAGTGALVVAAAAGAASPDGFGVVTAVVSGALFVIGIVAFLWGYATGVVRSRDERVTLGGLFFLAGTAPAVVRFRLRLAFAVQVVVAIAVAAIRPYTAVAFVVLGPMYGLGLMAVWGARHGTFVPKGTAG